MQWNLVKARENERKHGICFSDIEPVFHDPLALTMEEPYSREEQRFVTVGRDGFGRILVVVFAYRGEDVRVISARKATRMERELYERGI